jgi:hypothetical protein
LCEPSQNGAFVLCLQPQSHSFCGSETLNRTGVNSPAALCEPSQNGWRRDWPQRHQKYSPAASSTT